MNELAIHRKDPVVTELVEHFEARYKQCGHKIKDFWDSLTPDEVETLEAELVKVSMPTPESDRYYLENYHIIQTKGEDWEPPRYQTIYPFKDPQEILWEDYVYCWENNIPTWWILLKARQIGWSTMIQAMIFKRTAFFPLMSSLIIADEKVRSEKIFDMSRLAYLRLPCWMKPEVQYETKGEQLKFDKKDAKEREVDPGLNSTIYVDAANKPTGSSRGFTLHNLHATECSSYNDPKVLSRHIIPAVAKNNPLTIACLESTAEGRGYFYHRVWKEAMAGKVRWRPVFAAWWKEKTYSKPFRNIEEEKTFALTEAEEQIKQKVVDVFGFEIRDDQFNWRRTEEADFAAIEGSGANLEQEYPSYPEAAFKAQGQCAFPVWKLEEVERRDVRDPQWTGEIQVKKDQKTGELVAKLLRYPNTQVGPFWMWNHGGSIWPKDGLTYYVSADPGEGVDGGDFSTIQVFLVPDHPMAPLQQVAELEINCDGTQLAKYCYVVAKMYNRAEIAPECNRITTVVTDLIHIYQYHRIYRWRNKDKFKNIYTNFLGWLTTSKSRGDMIDRFRTLLVEDTIILRSQRLLDQCFEFVRDDGKLKYEGEFYDDLLMAAMINAVCALDFDSKALQQEEEVAVGNPDATHANTDYSPVHDREQDFQNSEFMCL